MNNFKKIEQKWQNYWEKNNCFSAIDNSDKEKFYALVEFPYPSGIGLHIGHIKAYMGLEVLTRKRRREGQNVLFPIGFDAFGLPTENYAIKTGRHPREVTLSNIENFTNQLKKVGFSFDWKRMIDTTDPKYYKWTQWIFLQLFKKGLAFRDKTYVNFCPKCKVVLSNEDSQGGKCDRCDTDVIQKEKDVWFLRITDYADKLLEGLESLETSSRIKQEQINWIGKSNGAYIQFKVKDSDQTLKVYTTRPDTLFGATFMVIAPEHPLIRKMKAKINNIKEIEEYKKETSKKTEFERVQLAKEKTGVKIEGIKAINPVNNSEIPIFIADYVMMNYGTGAIMAVPAHDDRDYEFATKFNISIIPVIKGGDISKEPYIGEGDMINSGFLNDITKRKEAINKTIKYLKEKGVGEKTVQFKMQDWAFNRQRYWGEPIPIIHCKKCGMVPIPEKELPLKLPEVDQYEPTETGESPLATIEEWVNVPCPKCGEMAKRETDTMPQWAGSSWYYLRYIDPSNNQSLADFNKLKYWLKVDWYNGGMEHVTRHVIYSRFWHRFLYDIGIVPTKEPYAKRTNQGLVLGPDGEKMSKSKGNVINPNEIVDTYGADVLRTYILFIGEYDKEGIWSENGVKGVDRFLNRVEALTKKINGNGISKKSEIIINKTIKKVTEDIESMKYNTAIASLMELTNSYYKKKTITKEELDILIRLLNPFAPHLTEEINEILKNEKPLVNTPWPKYDKEKTKEETYEMVIQINGKVREKIETLRETTLEEMKEIALKQDKIKKYIDGHEIIKTIVIPQKLVNIVIK